MAVNISFKEFENIIKGMEKTQRPAETGKEVEETQKSFFQPQIDGLKSNPIAQKWFAFLKGGKDRESPELQKLKQENPMLYMMTEPVRMFLHDTAPGQFADRVSLSGAKTIFRDPTLGSNTPQPTTGDTKVDAIADTMGGLLGTMFLISQAGQLSGAGMQSLGQAMPALQGINPAALSALRGVGTAGVIHGLHSLSAPDEYKPGFRDFAQRAAWLGTSGALMPAATSTYDQLAGQSGYNRLLFNPMVRAGLTAAPVGGVASLASQAAGGFKDAEGIGDVTKKTIKDALIYGGFNALMQLPGVVSDKNAQNTLARGASARAKFKQIVQKGIEGELTKDDVSAMRQALKEYGKSLQDMYPHVMYNVSSGTKLPPEEFLRTGLAGLHFKANDIPLTLRGEQTINHFVDLVTDPFYGEPQAADMPTPDYSAEYPLAARQAEQAPTAEPLVPAADATKVFASEASPTSDVAMPEIQEFAGEKQTELGTPIQTPIETETTPKSAEIEPEMERTDNLPLIDLGVKFINSFNNYRELSAKGELSEETGEAFANAGNELKEYIQQQGGIGRTSELPYLIRKLQGEGIGLPDFQKAMEVHQNVVETKLDVESDTEFDEVPGVVPETEPEAVPEHKVDPALLRKFWGISREKKLTEPESRAIWKEVSGKDSLKQGTVEEFEQVFKALRSPDVKEKAQELLGQVVPEEQGVQKVFIDPVAQKDSEVEEKVIDEHTTEQEQVTGIEKRESASTSAEKEESTSSSIFADGVEVFENINDPGTIDKLIDLIEDEYEAVALRGMYKEQYGDKHLGHSYEWHDEDGSISRESIVGDSTQGREMLGTSAIEIAQLPRDYSREELKKKVLDAFEKASNYGDGEVALIKGNPEYGEAWVDPGEIVLSDAEVIGIVREGYGENSIAMQSAKITPSGRGSVVYTPENTRAEPVPELAEETTTELRPPLEPTGKTETVITPEMTKAEVQFALVEADELLTSDMDGYDQELQDRLRDKRQGLDQQIEFMAKTLEPDKLGSNVESPYGSPIVGTDWQVEVGNGRVMAIRTAYEKYPLNAERYKGWLAENADEFGINKDALEDMEKPVLVRVRTGEPTKSGEVVDRQRFAEESNMPSVASHSPVELALKDAKKIAGEFLNSYKPSETGNLNAESNRYFIREFMESAIGKNERNQYLTAEGTLNKSGLERMRNAMLAKAYGENLHRLNKVLEYDDDNVRRVTVGMLNVAGEMAKLKEGTQEGLYRDDLDISNELTNAVDKLSSLRRNKESVEDYLIKIPLPGIEDLTDIERLILQRINQFGGRRGSQEKIIAFLENYIELAKEVGDLRKSTLPGFETEQPTKEEIIEAAARNVEVTFPTRSSGETVNIVFGRNMRQIISLASSLDKEVGDLTKGLLDVSSAFSDLKDRIGEEKYTAIDIADNLVSALNTYANTKRDGRRLREYIEEEPDSLQRNILRKLDEFVRYKNPNMQLAAFVDNYAELAAELTDEDIDKLYTPEDKSKLKEELVQAAGSSKLRQMNLQLFAEKWKEEANGNPEAEEWAKLLHEFAGITEEFQEGEGVGEDTGETVEGEETRAVEEEIKQQLDIEEFKPATEAKKELGTGNKVLKNIEEETSGEIDFAGAAEKFGAGWFYREEQIAKLAKIPKEERWIQEIEEIKERVKKGQPKRHIKIPFSDKEVYYMDTRGLENDSPVLAKPLTTQYVTGISPWDTVGEEVTTLGVRASSLWHSIVGSFKNELAKKSAPYSEEQAKKLALMLDGQEPVTDDLREIHDWARGIFDEYRTPFGITEHRDNYYPHTGENDPLEKAILQKYADAPQALDYFARHKRTGESELISENAFEGLAIWFERGAKATVMEDFLRAVDEAKKVAHPSRHFWLDEYAKVILGMPGTEEQFLNRMVAMAIKKPDYKERHIKRFVDGLTELWYDSAMLSNLFSAVKNTTQNSLTIAYLSDGPNLAKGAYHWAMGVKMSGTKTGKELLKYCEVLTDREILEGIDSHNKLLAEFFKPYNVMAKVGWTPYRLADISNVTNAYLGGVHKALTKGYPLERAIAYGNECARRTQYTYGPGGLLAFKGPITRLLGVVNSWPMNWMRLLMSQYEGAGALPTKEKAEIRKILKGLPDELEQLENRFKEENGGRTDWGEEELDERAKRYSRWRIGATIATTTLMVALYERIFGVSFESASPKETLKGHTLVKFLSGEALSPMLQITEDFIGALKSKDWTDFTESMTEFTVKTAKSFVPARAEGERVAQLLKDIMNDFWAEDTKLREKYKKSEWEALKQLWGTPLEQGERRRLSKEFQNLYTKHFDIKRNGKVSLIKFQEDMKDVMAHAQKLGYTKEGIEKIAKNAKNTVRSSSYNELWKAVADKDDNLIFRSCMRLAATGATAGTIMSSYSGRDLKPSDLQMALKTFAVARAKMP